MNRKQKLIIALVVILAVATVAIALNLHVWEDGSWAIGQYPYIVTGCPVGQPCSTSPGFAVCAEFANSVNSNGDLFLLDHGVSVADCNGIVEFGE